MISSGGKRQLPELLRFDHDSLLLLISHRDYCAKSRQGRATWWIIESSGWAKLKFNLAQMSTKDFVLWCHLSKPSVSAVFVDIPRGFVAIHFDFVVFFWVDLPHSTCLRVYLARKTTKVHLPRLLLAWRHCLDLLAAGYVAFPGDLWEQPGAMGTQLGLVSWVRGRSWVGFVGGIVTPKSWDVGPLELWSMVA